MYLVNAPSLDMPISIMLSHMFFLPSLQFLHRPQVTLGSTTTWSPTPTDLTAAPISSTPPARSWPSISRGVPAPLPSQIPRSLLLIPPARTLTSTLFPFRLGLAP